MIFFEVFFEVFSISLQGLKREMFYFLPIAVMFGMKKKKKKNESKRKHLVPELFHKQEEKRPFNDLTSRITFNK